MSAENPPRYTSFAEFYPYYLQEHSNATCRRLHYVGSLLVLSILGYSLLTQQWLWLLALPVAGSRPLALASCRISASLGFGGGILARRASSHCNLPSQAGSLAGGKGRISLISGTFGSA